jgi:hypothetical protein
MTLKNYYVDTALWNYSAQAELRYQNSIAKRIPAL